MRRFANKGSLSYCLLHAKVTPYKFGVEARFKCNGNDVEYACSIVMFSSFHAQVIISMVL